MYHNQKTLSQSEVLIPTESASREIKFDISFNTVPDADMASESKGVLVEWPFCENAAEKIELRCLIQRRLLILETRFKGIYLSTWAMLSKNRID